MKKILLLLFVILLGACSTIRTYDEISYSKFKKMINNKESFIIFIGSTDCSACDSYKRTVNDVISKYNVDIKYIDLAKLSEKDESELTSKFPITGTPTTIFIEKGKEKDTYNRIVGSVKYSKIISKLKENKYIKGW